MKAHSRVAVDRGEHRRAREGERAQPVASTGKGVIAGLMAATATGSLGLGAGGTAGALVAARMTGGSATAGLPLERHSSNRERAWQGVRARRRMGRDEGMSPQRRR